MKSFVRVVIRRADGRFLVLREPGRPFWNFPGGKVEPDEKPIDAAPRELREETSIEAPVTSLELIAQGVYDVLGTPWEGFFFFAHEAMGECVPERADPPVEWSWVTSAEMVALAALPGLLTSVAEKVDAGGMVTDEHGERTTRTAHTDGISQRPSRPGMQSQWLPRSTSASLNLHDRRIIVEQWVELSIFYTLTSRSVDDPPKVDNRGIVLYGEGLIREKKPEDREFAHGENLGDGLRLLKVSGTLNDVASRLVGPFYDHRLQKSKVNRVFFGFVRRPPILGLPDPESGVIRTPATRSRRVGRIHQFVSADKEALFAAVAGSTQPDRQARARAGALINKLSRVIGEDFDNRSLSFLGDILIVERYFNRDVLSWHAHSNEDKTNPRTVIFTIDDESVLGELHWNARIYGTDGMVINDLVHTWRPQDDRTFRIDVEQGIGSIHVRAWFDGQLVLDDHSILNASMQMTTTLAGGSFELTDRLSSRLRRAPNARAKTITAASHVKKEGFSNTVIVGKRPEPWKRAKMIAAALFYYAKAEPLPEEYFPVGAEGRALAIMAFATKISNANDAWLVDPFFDAVGAAALLPRIRNQEIKLKIITNLPDGGPEVDDLNDWLENASALGLPPQLEIFRVKRLKDSKQDFHDRYVITAIRGEHPKAYMLSNSFSGLATKFPLVVTEVGPGLTAALFDMLEEQMERNEGQNTIEKLWPRTGKQTYTQPADTYFFTGWRFVLSQCVSRRRRTERQWLIVADAMGFLHLGDDEVRVHWGMKPACRRRFLDRLLKCPMPRPRLRARRSRSLRPNGLLCSRLGTMPLGARISILGELVARGFSLTPAEIAARLKSNDAGALEAYLRITNALPADPCTSSKDTTQSEMAIRQAMQSAPASCERIAVGCAWRRDFDSLRLHRNEWGRIFVYRVLCRLEPVRAVRVAEQLLDPALLRAVADNLVVEKDLWWDGLSLAFMQASSPVLRALGVQSLVPDDGSHRNRMGPPPPEDPMPILTRLGALNISRLERAMYVAVWGASVASQSLSSILVDLLEGQSVEGVEIIVAYILEKSPAFLESFLAEAARVDTTSTALILDVAMRLYASPLRMVVENEQDPLLCFNTDFNLPLAVTIARAVAELSRRRGVACRELLAPACDSETSERHMRRFSPLRRNPRFKAAAFRRGWMWLIELLASEYDPSGAARITAVEGARRFVAEVQGWRFGDLLAEIEKRVSEHPQS